MTEQERIEYFYQCGLYILGAGCFCYSRCEIWLRYGEFGPIMHNNNLGRKVGYLAGQ